MDKPGCVFVLGADASVVTSAVESHYQNEKVTGQNAADYLEKIIQEYEKHGRRLRRVLRQLKTFSAGFET